MGIAGYNKCYLNRQIIVLLSGLGVPDEVFLRMQEQHLAKLGNLLTREKSLHMLGTFYQHISNIQGSGISLVEEPFFRSLRHAIYNQRLHQLTFQSRIFVPDGQVMMGVVDETGKLEYGQIFLQSSRVRFK
jgi:RNA-dependent RNA polymerase